jgi:hypothetical protein
MILVSKVGDVNGLAIISAASGITISAVPQ